MCYINLVLLLEEGNKLSYLILSGLLICYVYLLLLQLFIES
jgi:hypothetical protein